MRHNKYKILGKKYKILGQKYKILGLKKYKILSKCKNLSNKALNRVRKIL